MYRLYLAAVDMFPGMLLLIPVYLFLNKVYFHSTRKSIFCFLFSCYLCVVYVLVGLPTVTYIRPEINLNLIPFSGMADDLKNSFLNVLLFVPLGFMPPLMWKQFRLQKHTILFCFMVSAAIELLQMLTFRTTDINDLITNTFGSFLGFLCVKPLLRKCPPATQEKYREVAIVITVVLLVMFFVYPFFSAALWDFLLS